MPTQLERMLEKQRQIDERVKALQARERTKERAKDTRRKILIGGVILARVKRGEWPEDKLRAMLDKELKENRDRALFGLPLLESSPASSSQGEAASPGVQTSATPETPSKQNLAAVHSSSPEQPKSKTPAATSSGPAPVERRKSDRRKRSDGPPGGIERRKGERRRSLAKPAGEG